MSKKKDLQKRIEQVQKKLNELPTWNSEEIARRLREKGIGGKRGSSNSCPLAHYLGDDVEVGRFMALVDGNQVELTSAASRFVTDFDAGYFPFLEIK